MLVVGLKIVQIFEIEIVQTARSKKEKSKRVNNNEYRRFYQASVYSTFNASSTQHSISNKIIQPVRLVTSFISNDINLAMLKVICTNTLMKSKRDR